MRVRRPRAAPLRAFGARRTTTVKRMPGVVGMSRRRLAPLLLLVVLLAAAPRSAAPPPTPDASGHRAALDRVHALSLSDHVATSPTDDRRPLPLGPVPTVAAATLLALLIARVVRTHRLPVGRPWSAFRRRAPPLLRIAF
jgi:hypothetical protein